MFALNQSEPYPDPMSISEDMVHLPGLFSLLNKMPRREMKVGFFCLQECCCTMSRHNKVFSETLHPSLFRVQLHSFVDQNRFLCDRRFFLCRLQVKLKHYTKFLFVQDPFVRLISAYRNKFMKSNEYYFQNFGRTILRLYGNQSHPPQTVDKAFASGVRPSFYNFVQYLLTERKVPFEPHWRQMHRLCHPCHIQ